MSVQNPYDDTFDGVEKRYIQILERFQSELGSLLRPSLQPALTPEGAPELRARIEGQLAAAKEARLERQLSKLRADLLKYFPEGRKHTVLEGGHEEGEPAEEIEAFESPAPGEVYEYVRAAYEAYGELLGEL